MKQIFLMLFLFFSTAAIVNSQDITDEDRRSFDNFTPIKIDVDGDGIEDTIKSRIYKVNSAKNQSKPKPFDIKLWIVFDLKTSNGLTIRSFFKYRYGTNEAEYWVYALKSAGDINKDGKTDLVFYAGDDTSDETVWLVNKGNRFVAMKKKTTTNDEW